MRTPATDRSNVGPYTVTGGYQIDGRKVRFWATKKEAVAVAKLLNWPLSGVEKVSTRFQIGYALLQWGGGFLSREEFAALRNGTYYNEE